ncbi:hypothetical protein ACTACQ_05250 [Pseudomonas syringae]|uniref:hypothetical protein n=1 Tax=Pseudomonas syringae TaxID=317 RepID=UPI003F79C2EC
MSIEKVREEYEAWVLSKYPNQHMGRFATGEYHSTVIEHCWQAWQASREALPTWQQMAYCPKHVDVLFFNERNGVIPGRLTDADSLMTDKERDEWGGGEEAQYRIDAFGFGHWGVDRMDGSETPSYWMPYPEEPVVASVLGETVSVPKELCHE